MLSSNNNSFAQELLELGEKTILKAIFEHPLILSLAGSPSSLSKNELIIARNKFFIQDYFYLVYGHRITRTILLDTIAVSERKRIANFLNVSENYDPILSEEQNPLFSTLIESIRNNLARWGLLISEQKPTPTTLKYILFKIETAFQGEVKAITAGIACFWVFQRIGVEIDKETNIYLQDPEIKPWMQFYTEPTNITYLDKYCEALIILTKDYEPQELTLLKEIFVKSCFYEYRFIDSLLK